MTQFFHELFEYTHKYNQALAEVFEKQRDIPERAVRLYSHILNAHSIWNHRIESKKPPFGVWDVHAIELCKGIDQNNYDDSLRLLSEYDLDHTISYTNTKGQSFNNTVRDILFHVINHSTYHRGQIVSEFRQYGIEPLVTDYIFYKR